jgi:phosphomannomutase
MTKYEVRRTKGGTGVALVVTLVLLAACDSTSPQGNRAPSPPAIEVPADVVRGQAGDFAVTVHDPDGDRVRVFVAWGDGDTSDYGSFVYSMQTVHFEHTYASAGTFVVRGRCHDTEPLFSDWSSAETVAVSGR